MTAFTGKRVSFNYNSDMENLSDMDRRILRLLHLIKLMNEGIAENTAANVSAQNWTELKARFEKELYEVLTVEMGVRFPAMALAA